MFDFKNKGAFIAKANRELVEYLLSMNTNNRNVRKKHVEWLVAAIKEGDFHLTGQGIGVSETGVLLDGQHRLIALRDAGYPHSIDILVVHGLKDKSQIYVDQHAKRSLADVLRLALDKTVSTKMTAILNFMIRLKEVKGNFEMRGAKITPDEALDYMSENTEELALLTMACGQKMRTAACAAIFSFADKYDTNIAYQFANQVRDGEHLSKTDPAYKLRKYLDDYPGTDSNQMMETYKNAVSACIAFAQGKKLESLRPSNSWANLPKKVKRAA